MKLGAITSAALLAYSANGAKDIPVDQCKQESGCVAIPEAACFNAEKWFDCNWDGIFK